MPCSYQFTKQLTGVQLHEKALEILKNIEKCGFLVIRIITDNAKTNLTIFKLFGSGTLPLNIQHFFNTKREL